MNILHWSHFHGCTHEDAGKLIFLEELMVIPSAQGTQLLKILLIFKIKEIKAERHILSSEQQQQQQQMQRCRILGEAEKQAGKNVESYHM